METVVVIAVTIKSWLEAILQLGFIGISLVLGGLSLLLALECWAALLPRSSRNLQSDLQSDPQTAFKALWETTAIAILIPAHNEAAVIAQTLQDLQPQLKPQDRIVVVADNCEDDTAAIVQGFGVTVLQRCDAVKRGKGYALDYGLQFLQAEPPAVVVIIDADCRVQAGAIAQLTVKAAATQCPVQAKYLMIRPEGAALKEAITVFAARVKNWVRLQGLLRLGLPSLLTGTGMAFPWAIIRSVEVANAHLVEDMKLGLDLLLAGHPPQFVPEAEVSGLLPQKQTAIHSQRTRWEHGRMQLTIAYVPRLLLAALQQRRLGLVLSALDLLIPPLSLFVVLWAVGMLGAIAWGGLTHAWMAAGLLAGAGVLLIGAVGSSWLAFGQADLPLHQLFLIPLVILGRLPLYFKFLTEPQQGWVRTERDAAR